MDYLKKHESVRSKEAKVFPPPNIPLLESKVMEARTPAAAAKATLVLNRAYAREKQANQQTMERALRSAGEVEEWTALMEKLAKVSWVSWTWRIFLLLAPIIFYNMNFTPCFVCFDFQAAVTHEIGYVLGLARPDEAARVGQNIMVSRPAGEALALDLSSRVINAAYSGAGGIATSIQGLTTMWSAGVEDEAASRSAIDACGGVASCLSAAKINCWEPWARTVVRPNSSSEFTTFAPSIMETFSIDNPSKCITQDDLDALNVLYPVCDFAHAFPVCTRNHSKLGVLRLFAHVFLLMLILLSAMALGHHLSIHWHEVAHLKGLERLINAVKDRSVEMVRDGKKLSKAEQKAMLLDIHLHKLTQVRHRLLRGGRALQSPEVLLMDARMQALHATMARLRGGEEEPRLGNRFDEEGLLADFLTPTKELTMRVMATNRPSSRRRIDVSTQPGPAKKYYAAAADSLSGSCGANDAGSGVRPPASVRKAPTSSTRVSGLAAVLKAPQSAVPITPTVQETQKGWLAREEAKATPGGGMYATPIAEPTMDSTVMGSVMDSTVDTTF